MGARCGDDDAGQYQEHRHRREQVAAAGWRDREPAAASVHAATLTRPRSRKIAADRRQKGDRSERRLWEPLAVLKVLVVDDDPMICTALQILFESHGLETVTTHTPADALDLVAAQDFGVVVQDMNFTPREHERAKRASTLLPRHQASSSRSCPFSSDGLGLPRDRGPARQGGRQRLHGQALGRREARPHGSELSSKLRDVPAGEPRAPGLRACACAGPSPPATICAA